MTTGPKVCALAGPECEGDVRQFMNAKWCAHHGPEVHTPDPAYGMAHRIAEANAQRDAARAQAAVEKNEGMALLRKAAEAQRDESMAQVDQAASDEWKDAARRAIWWLANNRKTFTVDDVWWRLAEQNVPEPSEPRALGPVLMRALRAGAIHDTGTMTKSHRRNASKITVYALQPKGTPA